MTFGRIKTRRDEYKIWFEHLQQWDDENTPRRQIFNIAHSVATERNVDGVAFTRIDTDVGDSTCSWEEVAIVMAMQRNV
jgi:hypothetical protein